MAKPSTVQHKVDFLVIGLGIAGVWVSHFLQKLGKSVVAVDSALPGAAWPASLGVFTPVAGPRASEAWQAKHMVQLTATHYRLLEQELGSQFFHPMSLRRILRENNFKYWDRRRERLNAASWLLHHPSAQHTRREPLGSVLVGSSGVVDVQTLCRAFKERARQNGWLREGAFQHRDLVVSSEGVRWKDVDASMAIFCEGHCAVHNPWLTKLPLQPTKGERITLETNHQVSEILYGQYGLVPWGHGIVRVGSTFSRTDLSLHPTPCARNSLLTAACALLGRDPAQPESITVAEHCVGIRPTIAGHLPVVGRLGETPLAVVNGLGSHGVLFGVTAAQSLVNHIVDGDPLPAAIDVARFL